MPSQSVGRFSLVKQRFQGSNFQCGEQNPVLFNLSPSDDQKEKDNLDVLLNAIEVSPDELETKVKSIHADKVPTQSNPLQSQVPSPSSFAFLSEDNNPTSSDGTHTGAGISSLLAASQHLLSPASSAAQASQAAQLSWAASSGLATANGTFTSEPNAIANQLAFSSPFDIPIDGELLRSVVVPEGSLGSLAMPNEGGSGGLVLSERQKGKLPVQDMGYTWDRVTGERREQIRRAIAKNVASSAEGTVNLGPTGITTVLCLHSSGVLPL